MAVTLTDIAGRLRELIAALDRRVPRVGHAGEAAIARDSAVLREKAVNRLAEIAGQTSESLDTSGASADRGTLMVKQTAFPATPGDVATLSVQEFTFDLDNLDGNRVPSMERVCRTFVDDANRALVWWIRFAALKNWCSRTDVTGRVMISDAWTLRDACEVAASFPLNHRWEFDPEHFESAIGAVTMRRPARNS